ncbi:hypothetical protein ACFPJ1_40750 [Kribbella qitaiheensis]|uniref:hypothetical protein n=1 Tax=Kribbella qitaiheensis TaxID=1544730 RepID=UPI003623CB8B
MAIPRADANLGQRLKKLEDEVRRIKLMPSLSQSAVEPLAVRGSGWYDSSNGNEPKYYDGTNWVPVRDETIAVAQTTADTAQADATQAAIDAAAADAAAAQAAADAILAQAAADAAQAAADLAAAQAAVLQGELDTLNDVTLPALQTELDGILPITETDIADDAITTPKIAANAVTANEIAANTITANEMAADSITANELSAGAIDGLTITGSWIRTAATGVRIGLNDPTYPNQTVYYTNNPDETAPGRIIPTGLGGASLQLRGPDVTALASPATLDLGANNSTAKSTVEIDSDKFNLFSTETQIDGFSTLRLGDGSDYITLAGHTIDAEDGPLALVGTGATTSNGVPVVTTTDTQALTNKDLSSATNTLPTSVATLTGTQALTNKDLTASTNTFPGQMLTQVLSAAMTGGAVTVPTTEADITGATLTFSTAKANARYAVTASFYLGANTGGTGVATGKLNIDGSNQAAQANFTGATTLDRANVAQSWTGTLAAAGSHTFKLRHVMSGAGTFAMNPTHTALTVQIFE